MKVTLNAAQLAAHAAGATLESLGFPAGAELASASTDAPALVAPEIHASVVGERDTLKAQVTELTGKLTAAEAAVTTATAEMGTLKTNLSTAQAAIVGLTTERDGLKLHQDGLVAIARASTGKMLVALGGTAAAVAAMDVPTLLAENAKISDTFGKKFVPGGVAAPTPVDPKEAQASGSMAYLDLIPSGPRAKK